MGKRDVASLVAFTQVPRRTGGATRPGPSCASRACGHQMSNRMVKS